MQFIANENVSRSVIDWLRSEGHEVVSVKEVMRGESDELILARADAEQRIVLTNDKDFGELAFRRRLPVTCGIILLRLGGSDPDEVTRRVAEAVRSRTDWPGHFSVITDSQVRMRPLPDTAPDDDAAD